MSEQAMADSILATFPQLNEKQRAWIRTAAAAMDQRMAARAVRLGILKPSLSIQALHAETERLITMLCAATEGYDQNLVDHLRALVDALLDAVASAVAVPPLPAVEDERARFEAWCAQNMVDGWDPATDPVTTADGGYRNGIVQMFWAVWQARAALSAPAGETRAPEVGKVRWALKLARKYPLLQPISDPMPHQAREYDEGAPAVRKALDKALALLDQAPGAQAQRETGWLVEKHERGQILYLRIDNNGEGYGWRADSLKATRFARRQDAEHAAEGGELHDLRIAEHMWSGQ